MAHFNIQELMATGQEPVLPFEELEIQRQFDVLVAEQEAHGVLLGQAMTESSETFHDNAPADIINQTALIRTAEATKLMAVRNNLVVVSYPEQELDEVTLGSVVSVQLGSSPAEFPVFLTGYCRSVGKEITDQLPAETEIVTIKSPLGSSLLAKRTGESFSYKVPSRVLGGTVLRVGQFTPLSEILQS